MGQRLEILLSPTGFQHKKMLFKSEGLNEKNSENKSLGTQRLMPSPKHQSYTESSCSFHWPSTLPPSHQGRTKIHSISLPANQRCSLTTSHIFAPSPPWAQTSAELILCKWWERSEQMHTEICLNHLIWYLWSGQRPSIPIPQYCIHSNFYFYVFSF